MSGRRHQGLVRGQTGTSLFGGGGGNRGSGGGRGGGRGGGDRGGRGGGRGARGGRGGSGQAQVYRDDSPVPRPNQAVATIENDTFSSPVSTALSTLSLSGGNNDSDGNPVLPFRPSYGTEGTPVVLYTNYMEVDTSKATALNRYSIEFEPPAEQRAPTGKKLARLVTLLLKELAPKVAKATDFASILITNSSLGWAARNFQVAYFPETQAQPGQNPFVYKATVRTTGVLSVADILAYLSNPGLNTLPPTTKADVIQALNIVVGHGLRAASTTIMSRSSGPGNRFYPLSGPAAGKKELSELLDAFQGFALSIRPATGRLLLNIQIKHIAAFKPLGLDVVLERMAVLRWSDREKEAFLKKCPVLVTHLNNRQPKRIEGFARPGEGGSENAPKVRGFAADARNVEFWTNDAWRTVANHFRMAHSRTLKKPQLAVLNLGTKREPRYYPPEVCVIPDGSSFNAMLRPEDTASMIKIAVRGPHENALSLVDKGGKMLQQYATDMANEFGVGIEMNLLTVLGRQLTVPRVEYANSREARILNGGWNMRDVKFSKGATLPVWGILNVRLGGVGTFDSPEQYKAIITDFMNQLRASGMQTGNPLPMLVASVSTEADSPSEIDKQIKQAAESRFNCRFLLCILPRESKIMYSAIKKAGDVKYGMPTVCLVATKFKHQSAEKNAAYFANVALKINLKLGGSNQQLSGNQLGFIAQGKTMLVGLDVTHPAPGSKENAPSLVGIVASIDRYLSQWPAAVCHQTGREEMVEALVEVFKTRLQLWASYNNKALPERIIVYRDGVSEGQYGLVLTRELSKIRQACAEVYPADMTKKGIPYVTIVICGKRHNTRFYPTNPDHADARSSNPLCGTLVEKGVTEARIWDFFLQAHNALQGTAKPAHYVVIHDENFRQEATRLAKLPSETRSQGQIAADLIQKMTHNLCYMYGPATKAVSLCPPAYYADLVCDQARVWLRDIFDQALSADNEGDGSITAAECTVHQKLRNTMFYI